MDKKNIMRAFIESINDSHMMTEFIKNIFDYDNFFDYNYLFRMIDDEEELVIDIYDNVTDNRFNRYIFSFVNTDYDVKVVNEGNVFVYYININRVSDDSNKLLKLAYLFSLEKDLMIDYASSFLDYEFVKVIQNILK